MKQYAAVVILFAVLTPKSFSVGVSQDNRYAVGRETSSSADAVMKTREEVSKALAENTQANLIKQFLEKEDIASIEVALTFTDLTHVVAEIADGIAASRFKDRVVLAILRSPWNYDRPSGEPALFRSSGPYLPAFCIRAIEGRLPDERFDIHDAAQIRQFSDPVYRRRIANLLAQQIGEPISDVGETGTPPSSPSPPGEDGVVHGAGKRIPLATSADGEGDFGARWLIPSLTALICAWLAWFIMKRRP